jgi:hypothetical protein
MAERTGSDDASFRVQMMGRIATPADNWQTDVRVEITDITDGLANVEPVLSMDPAWQLDKGAVFAFQRSNGLVPKRHAALVRWVTAAEIPCDVLRFACRGRRKLQFSVCILCSRTGEVLSRATARVDYVNCRDGFRQQQQRRLEVLQATLAIAAAACSDRGQIPERAEFVLRRRLSEAAATFPPAERLEEWLTGIIVDTSGCDLEHAADRLLAWGQPADKQAAAELALQTSACDAVVSDQRVQQLIELAKGLGVSGEKFLEAAQRTFLGAGCRLENPSVLAGINPSMQPEQMIKRLNHEYRKWNARVTHPSAEIRQLAEQMLSLIADLRSGRISSSPCPR